MRVSALTVAAAWGALGYGLYFTTPDEQAWDDLEAGGRFAANFAVYLPYLALTLPVAAAVIYGSLARLNRLSPLWVITVAIAPFTIWVITRDYLLAALNRPGFDAPSVM
jgi:hypothetical protein